MTGPWRTVLWRTALWGLPVGLFILAGASMLPMAAAKGKASYAKDFSAFVKEVDKSYPFFDLKKIRKDWKKAKKALAKRAKDCKSDDEFILIVFDAVKCLRDGHISVTTKSGTYPSGEKRYYPGLGLLPATEGRVVVMHPPSGKGAKLRTGTIITKIDGKPAREVLEENASASWTRGGWFSSPQRARVFEFRTPLAGERGASHELTYLDGRKQKKIKLRNQQELSGWPRIYNMPADLKRVGRSFHFGELPSGVGYMYWRRIDASIWEGIPQALEAVPDAKGWIVDLRGNSGGGYGKELLDLIKALPKPVAAILDAGCVSAGETAARDLVKLASARLFGAKTAGSSTSKRRWEFPSGIATVRFSTRSRYGPDGKPIEFNGIEPHVLLEADPEQLQAGINTEIAASEAWVLGGGKR